MEFNHGEAMNFWWVNQNMTWQHEVPGGYMWSPKRNKRGNRLYFYDCMKRTEVGDIVFSYYKQKIQCLGVVTHRAASGPRPFEFGTVGNNWANDGWIVPVSWEQIPTPYSPTVFIDKIRPHLPEKYSPLNPTTGGGKEFYLTDISDQLAQILLDPLGEFGSEFILKSSEAQEDDSAIRLTEDAIQKAIENNTAIDETEKKSLINSRRGQGRFRSNLMGFENRCRLTGVSDPRLLIASHIKPWRACMTNEERLDGNNGLLLSPSADHLFDKGFISFEQDGTMLISTKINPNELKLLGINTRNTINVGAFTNEQASYLIFHRENIFLDGKDD